MYRNGPLGKCKWFGGTDTAPGHIVLGHQDSAEVRRSASAIAPEIVFFEMTQAVHYSRRMKNVVQWHVLGTLLAEISRNHVEVSRIRTSRFQSAVGWVTAAGSGAIDEYLCDSQQPQLHQRVELTGGRNAWHDGYLSPRRPRSMLTHTKQENERESRETLEQYCSKGKGMLSKTVKEKDLTKKQPQRS